MNEKQTTTTEVRGKKMDYTNEELEDRLDELEEYQHLMFMASFSRVSTAQIDYMNELSVKYGVDDPESWWNDTASIEDELERREAGR